MKIGFIGLGQMGKPMAMNMLKSGAELMVGARSAASLADFQKKNIRTTTDFTKFSEADIIFLCLPDGGTVLEVVLGEHGLAKHLPKEKTIVDFSTIAHTAALETARRLEQAGIDFLDAPVSGMEARAIDGTLTVMCGGKEDVFHRVKPFLECVGKSILYMGGPGNGQLAKLINQLLYNINIAALAEVLPMAVKMGLDPEKVGRIVNSGTGKSHASEFFLPRILDGNFSSSYPMKKAYKDMMSAAEISADLGIPLPVFHAATTTYQTALLKGHGDRDKGAMIRVFEEMLGVTFRKK